MKVSIQGKFALTLILSPYKLSNNLLTCQETTPPATTEAPKDYPEVNPKDLVDGVKEVQAEWESLETGAQAGWNGWHYVGLCGGFLVGALVLGAGVLW